MTSNEELVAYCPEGKRIRPSDWIHRLMGLAAAHWKGRKMPMPCGTCSACSGTTCFVYPVSLPGEHPKLVQDLRFCLHMLEVPEVTGRCPRNHGSPDLDHKDAA